MRGIRWGVLACAVGVVGCGDDAPADTEGGADASSSTGFSSASTTTGSTTVDPDTGSDTDNLPELELYDFAGGCYTVVSGNGALTRDGTTFGFSGGGGTASTPQVSAPTATTFFRAR